jgi:hypothetical protein
LQLSEPFPVNDSEFSLVIAHSVFTHLTMSQAEYYLSEVARILTPRGMAFTTWFFFDRASFPFLAEVYSLYTSEIDFSQAVLFDREWFLATVRNLGLGVRATLTPAVAGFQWTVLLVKRSPDVEDQFPLGETGAEWVCGASRKPMAEPPVSPELLASVGEAPRLRVGLAKPQPPSLFGALAELARIKRSRSWALGQALTSLVRRMKRLF